MADAEGRLETALDTWLAAVRAMHATVARLVEATVPASVAPSAYVTPDTSLAAAAAITLTPTQRLICERVLNVFETGTLGGRYGAISIFADGPNLIRQVTYGRSQTTEYGKLGDLVRRYVAAGGTFSEALRGYVPLIGNTALVDDARFKDLLRRAGNEDPVMQRVQDVFFDERYFQPALAWAAANGFTEALSALVIYDSFIHSGSILSFLRARFPELPPARGGSERLWITQYMAARHDWLSNHERADLRASAYRTRDLTREIGRGNWDLSQLPILANGTPVDARSLLLGVAAVAPGDTDIPYLGQPDRGAAVEEEEIWGDEGRSTGFAAAAVDSSVAALAGQILASGRIGLATTHVSGQLDQATARQNVVDGAAGLPARRSAYGGAPGGTVPLDAQMLRGLLALAERFSFSVSELAGGSHSANSRHYVGTAVDVNIVNGRRVGATHPDLPAFMTLCRQLGATEMRAPGDAHHDTHVHAAWPRPI